MKGVILAAGKGSRLYPVTHHIPKPLLPLAHRMTIEYAFDQLKGMGISEICVVVGENEPEMRAALGDGSAFGVKLGYAKQVEPKGLAHAVGFAQEFVGDDSFVLYLGDAIYDSSFEAYAKQFTDTGCANLNLVKWVEDPRRFGVANLDGDRIVKLVEKPQNPESNWAMAGMYIFGPEIWTVLPDLQPSARGEYEITDAIQMLIDRGFEVQAGKYEGTWFDTGTLDSFLDTNRFLIGADHSIADDAKIEVILGPGAVIGAGSRVRATLIENAVVLPGAEVEVNGPITNCVLMGTVRSDSGLDRVIRAGDDSIAY